ncbi:MAG: BamA/TamA family outer membrane protein, partial [Mariniphaga sp.]|nr:BamA/TamA family outer membrane protein [Mariniphaga sp.]
MTGCIRNISIFIFACLLLTACSGLKHLPPGEKLYTGADVKLESSENLKKKKKRFIENVAETGIRPEPNKSYLGMRPRLWLYMVTSDNPHTWLGKWLRKRGKAPVYLSHVKPGATSGIIDARLFNIGIFNGITGYEVVEKEHKAKIIYTSYIHKPYTFGELNYTIADDSLQQAILSEKEKSLVKPGNDYNLEILRAERNRVDAVLKNKGYFYFNPDYLLFKADTSTADRVVSVQLFLKDSIPDEALTVYSINRVFIDQDYTLTEEFSDKNADTLQFRNFVFRGLKSNQNIRPRVILKSVFLRNGEIYSRHNHNITLNRLMSMNNFKFVQVKFADSDTTAAGLLDVDILMTTMPRSTFRAEIDMVSKSNNFAGPRLNLSLLNRNTFRGAELLNLNLGGSYEAQLSGKSENLYSYSFNPQLELTLPQLLAPFNPGIKNSLFVPTTRFSLSYNYLKRVNYFNMQTFQLGFGYRWKENIRKQHDFSPVSLSFTSLANESDVFKELLVANPFLKKSYEEQFVAGASYSFTYNEQVIPLKRMQFFFQGTAETAGNAFSLAKIIGGTKPSSGNPATIAGSIYSQFAKLSVDFRSYYTLDVNNKLAMRFFAGVAKPYGNSSILPYSKQFLSGGANSLRAFQINSVGPGTHFQDGRTRGFLQLGGDIKVELNGEYRLTIYRFFKGALFADAGNVWLHKSNPAGIGSPFVFSQFMNEMAVGAGAGVRFDVSFFLLRFDLAFPLRKPWLEENHRWVAKQIDFSSSAWRKDNLVLNVAIGYPF